MPLARLALSLSALLIAVVSFAGPAAPGAVAEPGRSCNETIPILDGGGFIYDFANIGLGLFGEPSSGGSNGPGDTPPGPVKTGHAWDHWGGVQVFAPGADLTRPQPADRYEGPHDGCTFALGRQEILYPVVPMHGLEVQHRWYVDPGPLRGARILTVLRNPGAMPASVTVLQGDASGLFQSLGSDNETVARATSDGTGVFSPPSLWGVSTDESLEPPPDPALAHVWGGPGGEVRVSKVVLGNPGRGDILFWTWDITVPPGGTAAFVSYEIQAAVPSRDRAAEVAEAVAQADARQKQSPASLYIGMTAAEIAATMNWPHPAPTAAIAPVRDANAASRVTLDGGASAGAAGLPQCAITSFAWRADDGATGTGSTLSHFFNPGRHSATLTVTNDCGGPAQTAEVSFKVASGIEAGKPKLNRRAGTARLQVKALGPGKLTLSGKGLKKQVKKVKKAGTVSLLLKPTGKALRALQRSGEVKLKLKLVLKPEGGEVSTLSKTVTLQLLD